MNTARLWTRLGFFLSSISLLVGCTDVDIHSPDWDWDDDFPNGLDQRAIAQASFTFGPMSGETLSLIGIGGSVEVVGSPTASGMVVEGIRRVRSESEADAQEHLADLQVNIIEADGTVFIETVQPKMSWGRAYEIDYRITVPQEVALVLRLVGGPIDVRSVQGDLDIGGVSCDVTLGILKTTSAMLRASTMTGSVRLVNLELTDGHSSRFAVQGRLNGGEGTIRLNTMTGDITVRGI